METLCYTIKKKDQANYLAEHGGFQSCFIKGRDNSETEFDLLKLVSISPLIKSILGSFEVPLFMLGTVDIILPDSSVEEVTLLHHLMTSSYSPEDRLYLCTERWAKLQSLLDVLYCYSETEETKEEDDCEMEDTKDDENCGRVNNMDHLADHSYDGNRNSATAEIKFDSIVDEKVDSLKETKISRSHSLLKSNQQKTKGEVRPQSPKYSPVSVFKMMSELNKSETSKHSERFSPASKIRYDGKWISEPSPLSRKIENLRRTAGSLAENRLYPPSFEKNNSKSRSLLQRGSTPELGEKARQKPMPLSKKIQAALDQSDSEDIARLTRFFSSDSKPSKKKIERNKSDIKRSSVCGRCANCQINRQVKG